MIFIGLHIKENYNLDQSSFAHMRYKQLQMHGNEKGFHKVVNTFPSRAVLNWILSG